MSQHVSRTTHVEALTYAGVPQLVVYPQVGVPELSGQIRGLICGRGGVSPHGVPHFLRTRVRRAATQALPRAAGHACV